ncbi:DNA topoisomerase, partial [Klebsiella pneumoniae]|nr:DNA topoisomerase [Klebsiella pneumoniae]
MALYDKGPDADQSVLDAMRSFNKGDVITLTEPEIEEKMTTPPPHFTEATLIAAMVNIARFIEDEEAKKILKETDGLGTEATRAEIID